MRVDFLGHSSILALLTPLLSSQPPFPSLSASLGLSRRTAARRARRGRPASSPARDADGTDAGGRCAAPSRRGHRRAQCCRPTRRLRCACGRLCLRSVHTPPARCSGPIRQAVNCHVPASGAGTKKAWSGVGHPAASRPLPLPPTPPPPPVRRLRMQTAREGGRGQEGGKTLPHPPIPPSTVGSSVCSPVNWFFRLHVTPA